MCKGIAFVWLAAAIAAGPAVAGAPDNPGAAGQIVSGLAEEGKGFGEGTKDLAREGEKPGQNLQGFAEGAGGAPNPENDEGGGND
jgi:hypothetical protein